MKGPINSTKFILLHPSSLHKQGSGAFTATSHRLWLLALVSFLSLASVLSLFTATITHNTNPHRPSSLTSPESIPPPSPLTPLPKDLYDALLHYASQSNASGRMPDDDVRAVASVIHRCAPCNFLVFGLGQETLLWKSLNHGGRTVFIDESEYYISLLEERHPNLEAYDVAYTTHVSDLHDLLAAAREHRKGDCRPVQNLLFSDCRVGINDLPNQLYDVDWDVILVDGPRGYHPTAPGRMSAIFTAAVMARSAGGPGKKTNVFVHDYDRELERVCSDEFLCRENLVYSAGQLAHFVLQSRRYGGGGEFEFCLNRNESSKEKRRSVY